MIEQLQQIKSELILAALAALGGAWVWFFKRVLTNKSQIEALTKALDAAEKYREERRAEDRQALAEFRAEVRAGLKEVRETALRKK